ncbi:MAG: cell division protein SepF [Clostridia bacterium]|nr:cell division protein SepF [Clostridia bacterium]
MASLNIFNKQIKTAKEEDYDPTYYGQEEDFAAPAQEEKPVAPKPQAPARPTFSASMSAPMQMKLIRPTTFADGQIIANALMENHPVLIHLEHATKEVSHDLVCFLTGVVYAIGGQIQPVSETTYMLSPHSMEIAEEVIESEEPAPEDEGYGFAGFSGIGGYNY